MNAILDLRHIEDRLADGPTPELIEELQEAVDRFPAHVATRVMLAQALGQADRRADALREWRRAFRLCPDSPVILQALRETSARQAMERIADRLSAAALDGENLEDPDGDMDSLIEELESARIIPDPTIEPASEDELEPDVDDVASETLARIYANQKFYSEAARVYEKLAKQQPDREAEFAEKAESLRQRLRR